MPVTVRIPSYLAAFAEGRNSILVDAAASTAGEVLKALWNLYPALRDRIVDEQGELRQHINIFVDNESIRFAGGLATPVPDGAEIMIVPAVSGG
jgi:sulfur-carrier protein